MCWGGEVGGGSGGGGVSRYRCMCVKRSVLLAVVIFISFPVLVVYKSVSVLHLFPSAYSFGALNCLVMMGNGVLQT